MSAISAEDAFAVLAKWCEERTAIRVVMLRAALRTRGQGAVNVAIVNQVLPHSQKALLTLRDEEGDDVGVTLDLAGAEWESAVAGRGVTATFPNGNQYVFGESAGPVK